jgi:hypothetical protein
MPGANEFQFAIATITWARNDDEEAVLQHSLLELAKLDRPVYLTDAGSQPSFIKFLRSVPQFHVEGGVVGVWPQARSSLQRAVDEGHEHILYTEPDKHDFFSYLPTFLASGKFRGGKESPILIFSRSEKSFASFPSFQQMTETAINKCCEEVTGFAADYTYGPFILNKHLVTQLQHLPADIGWGWRPYAFRVASSSISGISCHQHDFFCPHDQQQDSPPERIYRMKQLHQNILGLTL